MKFVNALSILFKKYLKTRTGSDTIYMYSYVWKGGDRIES